MRSPRGWFERAPGPLAGLKAIGVGVAADDLIDVPVVAFLLEHPSTGLVLVDTGFQRAIAAGTSRERARNLGPVGRVMARPSIVRMEPEQAVAAQLSMLGIKAEDVGLIVMTHLHFDHASALCDFPRATVLVARREWQAAWAPAPFLHGYVRAQFDAAPSYRTFEFPAAMPGSAGPLEQTTDLFGDGSLTLVFTPGHTHGHISLVARLGTRPALIAGDAMYTMRTLRDGARPWRCEDAAAFEHTVAQLAQWDRDNPDALVIPGHDMEAWGRLEDLYS
jgi:N-acyl homoserine lactone hydrolase